MTLKRVPGATGLDPAALESENPHGVHWVLAGSVGIVYILPITLSIIVLLGIVYLSHRQTIAANPSGGGSYTVASENLGLRVGLVAGAALLVDYVLNVAVGISAGWAH